VVYEWHDRKRRANIRKHRVDFAEAVVVFGDHDLLVTEDDGRDEERFIAVGMDGLGRVLVVVFTWRGEDIRIISARKADRRERRQYEGVCR
jgi:uncharacterized protein